MRKEEPPPASSSPARMSGQESSADVAPTAAESAEFAPDSSEPVSTPPLQTRARRLRRIREELGYALVFTAVLLGVNLMVERTDIGSRLKVMTYNAMQHQLAAAFGQDSLPVSVVDISREPGGASGLDTSRKNLKQIIEALTKLPRRPLAIGLDIDMSPPIDSGGGEPAVLTQENQEFYEYCLKLSTRSLNPLPVFLGVDRTSTSGSDNWLWQPKYSSLAVALRASLDERFKMWRSIHIKGEKTPLRSISAALTDATDKAALERWPAWLRWAVTGEQEDDLDPSVRVKSFLVDYSPIDRLQSSAIPESDVLSGALAAKNTDLSQQVVIIGDSSNNTSDKLVVPDKLKAYPGVLVHACAAYTLLKSPLYELTAAGRIAGDLLLIVLITGTVTSLKIWFAVKHEKDLLHEHAIATQNWLTWGIIVFTFVAGVAFVDRTHLMWDDFPLVAIGLLYHRPIEVVLHRIVHAFQSRLRHNQAPAASEAENHG